MMRSSCPNIVMAKNEILNFSYPEPLHRVRERFDLHFDHPPNFVRQALVETANSTEGVLAEPEPYATVISYNEFTVTYELRFFIADYTNAVAVRDEIVTNMWYVAKRNGLIWPTRNLEVITMPAAADHDRRRIERGLERLLTTGIDPPRRGRIRRTRLLVQAGRIRAWRDHCQSRRYRQQYACRARRQGRRTGGHFRWPGGGDQPAQRGRRLSG